MPDVETAIAVLEDALNRCRREDMRMLNAVKLAILQRT